MNYKTIGIKKYLQAALLIFLLPFISSCFKKDDAVVLQPPGDVEVMQVGLGSQYTNQVYFQLNSLDTLSSDYRIWDLAFDASARGFHIWLNGGNMGLAAYGGSSNFEGIHGYAGNDWKWDASSWDADSTAIGSWTDRSPSTVSSIQVPLTVKNNRMESAEAAGIFLIDRGSGFSNSERFWKIVFQTVDDNSYRIKYANLNVGEIFSKTIQKNHAYNYAYFTFTENGKVVTPEPDKFSWDILFTRYRFIFYNPPAPYTQPLPYLVEGVLINPYKTTVAKDSTRSFSEINYTYARSLAYETSRDIIGYDWKTINLTVTPPRYSVKPYINYIIKDQRGYYWKLHFLDYYNEQGEKGYPKFEFQRL